LTYLCGLLFWQGRCYVALALPDWATGPNQPFPSGTKE